MSIALAALITDFFMLYLVKERNASRHTVLVYRDAFKMFLCFVARLHRRAVDRLSFRGPVRPRRSWSS